MMKRLYVNDRDVRLRRLPREVIIFGAGHDGQAWQKIYGEDFNIQCFLDNGIPHGSIHYIGDIPVYNAEDYLCKHGVQNVIVLSRNYNEEMCAQLQTAGGEPGQSYYIWEWYGNLDLEHIYAFIYHNQLVWGMSSGKRKSRKILCAMLPHCAVAVFTSYYSQVLAQKYDAEIVGAAIKSPINEPLLKNVYESFHTNDFLIMELSESQHFRANKLFDEIWSSLRTKEDWQSIKVNDINFGQEIYRNYARWIAGKFDQNKYEADMRRLLKQALGLIVYYGDYFTQNNVKAVLLTDALYQEGYVRILAWNYGARVYAIDGGRVRYYPPGKDSVYTRNIDYPSIFKRLTKQEQLDGLAWAKQKLVERMSGTSTEISSVAVSPWSEKNIGHRLLSNNGRLKVMIVPHSFIDDAYPYGQFMFADHEEWLRFLGEMSERTDYDWYIKYHPIAGTESSEMWNDIVRQYPRIKKLPLNISPKQLKEEGIDFALTLWGSCGYEYPLLGIQVITAGPNPYINYDFCWQAHNLKEYEHMLLNLSNMHKQINPEDIYQFYCVHCRYASPPWQPKEDIFYPKRQMYTADAPHPLHLNIHGRLEGYTDDFREWQYRWFLDEFSPEFHQKLLERCRNNIDMATAAVEKR